MSLAIFFDHTQTEVKMRICSHFMYPHQFKEP
ncbi:hypothetical protein SAMN06295879_2963 [Agreia bicolorata]|uniref:Uncharacterized protein n=1 Tax=Agreia bicolorata TaxID=110935 RepID=A0A1T4YEP6_9MICO|nr:hypothetical protein SAMN06295879_2963 [Agreia bicolorata]